MRYPGKCIRHAGNIHDNKICCASILPHVARTKKNDIKLWCSSPFYYTYFSLWRICGIIIRSAFVAPSLPLSHWKRQILLLIFACSDTSFDSAHTAHHGISISWIINFCFIACMIKARNARTMKGNKTIIVEEGRYGELYI